MKMMFAAPVLPERLPYFHRPWPNGWVLPIANRWNGLSEFSTSSDKKGVKVFGSFNSNDTGDRLNYSTIFFATEKSTITIQFIFEEGDENLDEIVRRIENSIDFVNG